MSLREQSQQLPRLAYRPAEAPAVLGVSEDFFREHIAPHLRWVRVGAVKLVAPGTLANDGKVIADERPVG